MPPPQSQPPLPVSSCIIIIIVSSSWLLLRPIITTLLILSRVVAASINNHHHHTPTDHHRSPPAISHQTIVTRPTRYVYANKVTAAVSRAPASHKTKSFVSGYLIPIFIQCNRYVWYIDLTTTPLIRVIILYHNTYIITVVFFHLLSTKSLTFPAKPARPRASFFISRRAWLHC